MDHPQEPRQRESGATPPMEKVEALALKFGLPADEELPALAELYAANMPFESAKPAETLEKLTHLRERMRVARLGGQAVGFVTVEPDGPVKGAAYLRCLIVQPDYRRQGIGAGLLKQAREMAVQLLRTSLLLRVSPSNTDAVAFVRKAGFMTVGALSSKKSGKLRLLMSQDL